MEVITASLDIVQNQIKKEFEQEAAGFCRIGYLLKQVRDQELYKERGYKSVFEFAEDVFGLENSGASRFMNINDKYSIGGNSMELKEEYREFGRAKLAEMLTLPLEIVDEITPKATREEIRELKREIKAENEGKKAVAPAQQNHETSESVSYFQTGNSLLKNVLFALFKKEEFRERLQDIWKIVKGEKIQTEENIMLAITGNGYAQGKAIGCFVFFKEEEISIIDRANNKTFHKYVEVYTILKMIFNQHRDTWQEAWEETYGEKLPVKVEAKISNHEKQQSKPIQKPEQIKEVAPKVQQKEKEKQKEEEPIEGQMEVVEYEGVVPEEIPHMTEQEQPIIDLPRQQMEEVEETKEEPEMVDAEIVEDECICQSGKTIVSHNGKIEIKISNKGLMRIESSNHKDAGIIKISHCPFCGEVLYDAE